MMVSPEQHDVIRNLLRQSLAEPGDVVEAGCHEGSTSVVLLDELRGSRRSLHLYDSFDGLPEDSGYGGQMIASRDVLERVVRQSIGQVFIHPGWFCATMPDELPNQICFAFVDCDVASSLQDCLPAIIERLTGTLVIHDYCHHLWGPQVHGVIEKLRLPVEQRHGMAVYAGGSVC